MSDLSPYERAADFLRKSGALVITAGAGMGVDSGLPDFRGDQGFWNAYPMYAPLGINFVQAANPRHFEQDPAFGWGFYGHRLHLYRDTTPHQGFHLLRQWEEQLDLPVFVVTSNVDGQFQKAGFPDHQVCEIHGSIHHLQCLEPCSQAIWRNEEAVPVDHTSMRAQHIPRCPHCGGVARPNILMFGDWSWIGARTEEQESAYGHFIRAHENTQITVVEMGAGTAIPSIRNLSDRLSFRLGAHLIRINPREPETSAKDVSLAEGALSALQKIDAALKN